MKARTPWLIVAVFLPLLAVSVAAQNLIGNGSFDHDASSWSNEGDPTVVLVHRTDAGSAVPTGSSVAAAMARILSRTLLRSSSGVQLSSHEQLV